MAKVAVSSFDARVCRGERADVDGPCPFLAEAGEDTGNASVDRLARIEEAAAELVTGEQGMVCGSCGCPLRNLGAFNLVPQDCPRIPEHNGE